MLPLSLSPGAVATRAAFIAVALAMLSACATNPVSGKRDFVMMGEEEEIALGRGAHKEILAEDPPYRDPEVQALVKRIGAELAAVSHRPALTYHFTAVDSPAVNAFALPGGYVYITRGLLAYMTHEAQLAGVLGHEIGHITARHGVRQHGAATATGILSAVLAVAVGSDAVGDLTNTLGSTMILGYGRTHELESDRLGAEYMAHVGYDPERMLEVIGILKDLDDFETERAGDGGRKADPYHGLFSTHPDHDRRLQEVVRAAANIESDATRGDDQEAFLHTLDGMKFGGHKEPGGVRYIRVVRATAGDTFAAYAREASLGKHGAAQLRLLNGMYPKGEPQAGQLIKVLR